MDSFLCKYMNEFEINPDKENPTTSSTTIVNRCDTLCILENVYQAKLHD